MYPTSLTHWKSHPLTPKPLIRCMTEEWTSSSAEMKSRKLSPWSRTVKPSCFTCPDWFQLPVCQSTRNLRDDRASWRDRSTPWVSASNRSCAWSSGFRGFLCHIRQTAVRIVVIIRWHIHVMITRRRKYSKRKELWMKKIMGWCHWSIIWSLLDYSMKLWIGLLNIINIC